MSHEEPLVKLWRSTPVEIERTELNSVELPRGAILTSARQGLTEAIAYLGLGRVDYVGIPDYSSHCVIDFIGRQATPVPIKFLPPEHSSAVLLYDQWGWQKPASARLEVKKTFPQSKTIWDRVDSLPTSFEKAARSDENEADVQVFSLSKTLGVGGGGLVWLSQLGWLTRNIYRDLDLVTALAPLLEDSLSNQRLTDTVERLIRNECDCHPPQLEQWLNRTSIDSAATSEHQLRRKRLELCLKYLPTTIPDWMLKQVEDSTTSAPGIMPAQVYESFNLSSAEISKTFNIEIPYYHFNVSDSYLNPKWTKVLAIPLHSEIDLDLLEAVLQYLYR